MLKSLYNFFDRNFITVLLFEIKVTQPPTSLRIITFRKSFINLKSTQNITLEYPGLDVKHSLHTQLWFQLFYIIICYEISNLQATHYTV